MARRLEPKAPRGWKCRRSRQGGNPMRITHITALIAAGIFLAFPRFTNAHDFDTTVSATNPAWNTVRLNYMPADRATSAMLTPSIPGLPPAPQFIIVLPNRWAVGQTLRVCF